MWEFPVSAKIILTISAIALFRQKRKSYDSRFCQKPFPPKSLETIDFNYCNIEYILW
jgi:hypothetical protein